MTPITDKQRIDFVQRNKLCLVEWENWWLIYDKNQGITKFDGRTWRQAVDKAIRAYKLAMKQKAKEQKWKDAIDNGMRAYNGGKK